MSFTKTYDYSFAMRSLGALLLLACLLQPGLLQAQQTRSSLEIVVEGHGNGFFARQKAAGKLGKSLDTQSIKDLYALMNRKATGSLSRDELLALKDVVCTKLDHQAKYPADLPEKLMEMYADTGHDVAWRDYCIQHLNTGFSKATDDQRTAISKIFWAATKEIDSTIAGTALIALNDHIEDQGIDKDAVAAKALEIVLSKTSGHAAKTTALQICAHLGERKCLPVARELAASTKARALKLSSIAAIGTLGAGEDRALLEKYASSTDRFVQTAAQSALKRLPGGNRKSR